MLNSVGLQDRKSKIIFHSKRPDGERECGLLLAKHINNIIVTQEQFEKLVDKRDRIMLIGAKLCIICICKFVSEEERQRLFKDLFKSLEL